MRHPMMQRLLALCAILIASVGQWAPAQTYIVPFCSGGPPSTTVSAAFGPMNSVAAAGATSRFAAIYTPSQLSGIAGQAITSLFFHRGTATGSIAGSPNFKIYLKTTTGEFPSGPLAWTDAINGASLVYDGNPATIVGTNAGWKQFPLSSNFAYSGMESLMVITEYANTSASSSISWSYEFTGPCVNTSSNNTTRYINNTTGTLGASLTSVEYRKAYIGFNSVGIPCTTPPTAGTITAPSTICSGTSFSILLSGNSFGSGQTFQLQSSADNVAFTNVGAAQTTTTFNTAQTANTFYRVAVTCAGNTANTPSVQVNTPSVLSGTYTINKTAPASATNFASMASAAAALGCGISGPVTLNIAPNSGPYEEQVVFTRIPGASVTNRILLNGNGNTLSFNSTTVRPGLLLNGTDHFTIDSLTVEGSGSAAWGIVLTNGADSNVIRACTLNMNPTATTSAVLGIVINGSLTSTGISGQNGSGNLIERNTINGGFNNIYVYGSSTATIANANNVVRNNVLRDAHTYGITALYQQNLRIAGNDISRPTRTAATTGGGIQLSTGVQGSLVEKNSIHNLANALSTTTPAIYGLHSSASPPAAAPNRFENNLVYGITNHTGLQYGIFSAGADSTFWYHNTLVLDDPSATMGTTHGIHQSTTTALGNRYFNNIVVVSRAGTGIKRAIHIGTTAAGSAIVNNNAYYFDGTGSSDAAFGQLGTTNFATITAWKASGSFDQLSVEGDPLFQDPSTRNFRPQNNLLDNIGAAGLGVTTDFANTARSATPDPGAFEFAGSSCTNPASAGQATVSADSSCVGTTFRLALQNNTVGIGQTYQWQVSTNGNTWTNLTPAPRTIASLDTFQTESRFYRAAVRCQAGNTVFSSTVFVTSIQQLGGSYTINNSLPTGGNNFASIGEAVRALRCGVSGPVTFTVAPGTGPYQEQVIIDSVRNASNTNRIRFVGNGATISFAATTSQRAIVRLNGARFITLDSFTIESASTGFGWGIQLTNGASNDSIVGCTINLANITSTTESNFAGILLNGSLTSATTGGTNNANTIARNTVIGGYTGIGLYGVSTNVSRANRVLNNQVLNWYGQGIELVQNDSGQVSFNDVNRLTRSTGSATTVYGITLGTGVQRMLISANRIHDTHTALAAGSNTVHGISSTSSDATAANANRVVNNAVYNLNTATGTIYGLYNSGSDGIRYLHNSVVIDLPNAASGAAYGFYQTTAATSIRLYNNLLYVNRGGTGVKYAIYLNTATTAMNSNYNLLLTPGSTGTNAIGFYNAQTFTTLADWKTANSNAYDTSSISVDPQFADAANGDFTPTATNVNGVATNEGITEDILNRPKGLYPDPGAFELILAGCTNPPTAGIANTTKTQVCTNEAFTLDVTGNSSGAGLRFQWQRSTDNVNFVNIGAPQVNQQLDTFQTATGYYRVALICNNGTPAFSASVLVTTPALIAASTFTINQSLPASATNFTSMAAAANHLSCGISGPIVFNVAPGSFFQEQVIIGKIIGTSAVNTVRFNGNGAVLNFTSTNTNERATLKLNEASHIIIDSFQIQAGGSATGEFGYAVQMLNNSDSNTISRSTIVANTSSSSGNFGGIIINATATGAATTGGNSLCDGNLITQNTITGGNVGVALLGSGTTSTVRNNRVLNNRIRDFHLHGIILNGGVSTLIEGNDISRPARPDNSTFTGILLTGVSVGTRVSKNQIHTPFGAQPQSTSSAIGISLSSSDATAQEPNIVSNNMIYGFRGGSTHTGISNTGSNFATFLYNSVLLDEATPSTTSTTTTTRAFYQTTLATDIVIHNNNFVVARGGNTAKQVMDFNTTTTTFSSRWNNLRLAAPATGSVVALGTDTYATLLSWQQSGTGRDTGSVSVDPLFVSPTDLRVAANTPISGVGRPRAEVTDDIDGEMRGITVTTPGVDERTSVLPAVFVRVWGQTLPTGIHQLGFTASATEPGHFLVQRSSNGQLFETIATLPVSVAGTHQMQHQDLQPAPGTSYYRIAFVAQGGGRMQLSNAIKLALNSVARVQLYPNPATAQVVLSYQVATPQMVTWQLTDMQGKVLMQQSARAQAGSHIQQIQVQHLSAGNYLLVLRMGQETLTTLPFIKR